MLDAPPAMTERCIQRWLFQELRSATKIAMPNYTPAGWWECDLFSVTKAGYFHEHEIKLSVADFRADAKKSERGWNYERRKQEDRNKHDELASACERGPSCFWFVVPEGLIESSDVPEWAGLKYAIRQDRYWGRTKIVRPAPRLHREKANPKVIEHAKGVCYWRYWNAINTMSRNNIEYQMESEASA